MPKATKPKATAETPPADPPEETPETPPATPPPAAPDPPETPPATPPPATPPAQPAAAVTDFDKGRQAERARISALQKLDRPATHAIVAKAIEDGSTAGDIAAACMEAMDKVTGRNARHADASSLDQIPASDGADDNNGFGSLLKSKVAARQKRRMRVTSNRN